MVPFLFLQLLPKKIQEDAVVMKIIKGLVKKGKIDDAIELVHDGKLEKELAKLTE